MRTLKAFLSESSLTPLKEFPLKGTSADYTIRGRSYNLGGGEWSIVAQVCYDTTTPKLGADQHVERIVFALRYDIYIDGTILEIKRSGFGRPLVNVINEISDKMQKSLD